MSWKAEGGAQEAKGKVEKTVVDGSGWRRRLPWLWWGPGQRCRKGHARRDFEGARIGDVTVRVHGYFRCIGERGALDCEM
jgi:hypothetical protein